MIAVLTGDLVESSAHDAEELAAIRTRLAEAAEQCNQWRPGLILGGPQFFRGDSWQLALSQPGSFLRVAIALRSALLALPVRADSRIGIGIGGYERLDPEHVSLSLGDAFTRSGNALDQMKRDRGFRIDMAATVSPGDWVPAMLSLAGELVGRLQPRQAELVWRSIGPAAPLQKQVAQAMGITPQTASEGLASAGLPALVAAAEAVETTQWRVRPKIRLV